MSCTYLEWYSFCTFPLSLQDTSSAGVGPPKLKKLSKDKLNVKGTALSAQNRKPVLSQSLSFPAKGIRANGTRKSVDAVPTKADAKHSKANMSGHSNGSVSSVAITGQRDRLMANGVSSKASNLGNRRLLVRLCRDLLFSLYRSCLFLNSPPNVIVLGSETWLCRGSGQCSSNQGFPVSHVRDSIKALADSFEKLGLVYILFDAIEYEFGIKHPK